MKISYNTLKRYIKDIKPAEEVAKDLVMHTAEVEDIHSQKNDFKNIVFGKIKSIEAHENADSLRVCMVDAWEAEDVQIVCGGSNLELGQGVAVAKLGATVSWHGQETITMKKTAIRWVESNGMICASEEIWLAKEYPCEDPKWILDFGNLEAKTWTNLAELLGKDDSVLEIDNKAINHRPDLFSHIWVIREICAINGNKFDFEYENRDFSNLKDLWIKNEINDVVKRYIGLKIEWVENIESPDYVKEVLSASGVESKGILIDLSNYSLYMYGQPTHIFDADKIEWNITIRYAKSWEKFLALDDKEYELSDKDIIIADSKKVLALGWVIGWKESSVSETTKNIIIEAANFDQATLRMTGKKLGIRTDSLNVFEKDILPATALYGVSLIVSELEKAFSNMSLIAYSDSYPAPQEQITIPSDIEFINRLIWKNYSETEVKTILNNLGIEIAWDKLIIPDWRKDLNYKADIAEEIARIDGYDKIEASIPEIQLWAIIQDNTYKIKTSSRNFFVNKGFYDMYTYSFVNESIMNKCNSSAKNLVPLKNSLSEEATHMKDSLIPNLLLSLEKNIRDKKDLKLFEVEKIFKLNWTDITEHYSIAWVITSSKDLVYYDIQDVVSLLLKELWVDKYYFEKTEIAPSFAHSWRTAKIVARGQDIWVVWEIHPKVAKNFDVNSRIWFFEINVAKLENMVFSIIKAKELSAFQASNFDISFVVDKETKWKDIQVTIEKTDQKIIEKVELFDIYENEERLAWKRSLSFKVFLQKMDSEISEQEKNNLIKDIVSKVEKKGWILR